MKHTALSALLLAGASLLATAACTSADDVSAESSGDIITVGQPLPAFAVTLADSSSLATADLAGRPSVIVLFNTSCRDCQRELPVVQQLYEELSDSVRFVCISRAEEAASVAAYWQSAGLTLPYSAQPDRTVYNLFATRTIPRIYVADATTTVTAVFVESAGASALSAAVRSTLEP